MKTDREVLIKVLGALREASDALTASHPDQATHSIQALAKMVHKHLREAGE